MEVGMIRLATDGIREAICEVRFEADTAPEITIGRLTDAEVWRQWQQIRLPTADIPEQLRAKDDGLRFSPSYQLVEADSSLDLVRVGSNVVSCHRLAPYPGWDAFGPAISRMFNALFATVRGLKISRIGFRYVNALSASEHFVGGAADLNVVIRAGEQDVGQAFVLVYSKEITKFHDVQVTIATPKFVQAPDGKNFDIVIDVDISSARDVYLGELSAVTDWLEAAHAHLKEEFFRLIPTHVMDKLRV